MTKVTLSKRERPRVGVHKRVVRDVVVEVALGTSAASRVDSNLARSMMAALSPSRSAMSSSLHTVREDSSSSQASTSKPWGGALAFYSDLLKQHDVSSATAGSARAGADGALQSMAIPIAAIHTLSEVIARSSSTTTTELLHELTATAQQLCEGSFNPISVTCGTSLFLRFLTIQRPPPEMSFAEFRAELVQTAQDFVRGSGRCRTVIAENMANFIPDGSVLLVHGYSKSRGRAARKSGLMPFARRSGCRPGAAVRGSGSEEAVPGLRDGIATCEHVPVLLRAEGAEAELLRSSA